MGRRYSIKEVLAVILGGGQGARLFPLTAFRAKPAVPVGGKYRLIDVGVSNCIHSGIERVYVLTQFNSSSLHRHIIRTYRFTGFGDTSVDILPTEQTPDHSDWFQSTTDAVGRAWRHFETERGDTVLILPGDHLYRMDYRPLIEQHWETGDDVTIAVAPVEAERAIVSGVVGMDDQGRIREYREQPRGDALEEMRQAGSEDLGERPYLASMEIYVFKKSVLRLLLERTRPTFDIGMELIPRAVKTMNVGGYRFEGFWQRIGSIASFYRVNLELAAANPQFSFYDPVMPIYTRPRWLPSAKIRDCDMVECLVAEGAIINQARLRRCTVGIRTRIESGADLNDSIIMGAKRYQTIDEMNQDRQRGRPSLGLGEGTVIQRAIIDVDARIGAGARITNDAGIRHFNSENYFIREGIVIVPRRAVILPGTII